MSKRADAIYESFVDEYGEELDDIPELLEMLVSEFPGATSQEILDFVVGAVMENYDEAPPTEDAVADFAAVWGTKV